MKPLCEIIALEILPAVRAMVARKLVLDYGLSQKQAAGRLGVSQPAISQYKKQVRGYKADVFRYDPGLMDYVNSLAKRIASGELDPQHTTIEFCGLCKLIRFGGAGCKLHKEFDPSLELCAVCTDNPEFYGRAKERKAKTGGSLKMGLRRQRKAKDGIKPLSKF